MLLLHKEIIEIILKGGVFDEKAVQITAAVLFFFLLSIPIESVIHLFARAYYAFKNTFSPMIFALIATVINIASCIFLSRLIGLIAIPIGFLVSSTFQLLLLVLFLSKKLKSFNLKNFTVKVAKILIAACAMAFAVYYLPLILQTSFLTTQIIRVIVGASLYFILTYLFKCQELAFFSNLLSKLTK
jgi:putative peptidoglycan lipid II flippase